MAKRKQSGASAKPRVNKSQAIRDYKKAHPTHKPAKIAEALGRQGIKVSAQFVSTILSTSKKKKKIGKPGRPKGSVTNRKKRPASQVSNSDVSFDSLLKVKQIVIEMGGIPQARAALRALEQLMD
jgi:hypothetical protein